MASRFAKAGAQPVRGDDPLPTAHAVRAAKDATLSALTAELAAAPWPPGEGATRLLADAPLVALAVLEATCPAVGRERLARCLGLDPLVGPEALDALRASGAWPARMFKAARAAMGQGGAA
jgi:hypothetical protein